VAIKGDLNSPEVKNLEKKKWQCGILKGDLILPGDAERWHLGKSTGEFRKERKASEVKL